MIAPDYCEWENDPLTLSFESRSINFLEFSLNSSFTLKQDLLKEALYHDNTVLFNQETN
jgi:hypothetical protein